MYIKNFIPFSQKIVLTDENVSIHYSKNDKWPLIFEKKNDSYSDRLFFLQFATVGIFSQLFFHAIVFIRNTVTDPFLLKDTNSNKSIYDNYPHVIIFWAIAVLSLRVLKLPIEIVALEAVGIFGLFFPNEAKKILYALDNAIFGGAAFSKQFKPIENQVYTGELTHYQLYRSQ